jgi:short-subunit dehydrogenase
MKRFENQVVWITGASSGIGEALVYAFSREGARVILSSRRPTELERVVRQAPGPAERLHALPLDLNDLAALPARAAEAAAVFGPIDILVNNGGIGQRSAVEETDLAVDQAIMQTNYFGTIALTKAVLPSMLARRRGQLVVVSSLMGYLDTPLRSAYAASKHALHGYFDSLRAEVHSRQVRVLMVCPGYVRTEISLHALTGAGEKHGRMDRLQEKGLPPEVCAEKILAAIARGKSEVLIGRAEVLAVYLKRWFPGLYARLVLATR